MVSLPVYWPPKDLEPGNVKVDDLYRNLHANGVPVLWEQAVPCACRENPDLEQGRYDCAVCGSTGWEYLTGQSTVAIVTGISLQDMPYELLGRWEQGFANITVAPEQLPGYHDRYTLTRSTMVVQDLVARSAAGVTDTLRWPVVTRTLTLDVGGVPTATNVSVLHCRKGNTDGTPGAVLTLGTDFTVDDIGRIDWTPGIALGTAPAAGERYGIRYFGQPRYIVMGRPYAVRDIMSGRTHFDQKTVARQHAPLPVKVLCRLDWERRTL